MQGCQSCLEIFFHVVAKLTLLTRAGTVKYFLLGRLQTQVTVKFEVDRHSGDELLNDGFSHI